MKKCILMLLFFVISLVIAVLTEDADNSLNDRIVSNQNEIEYPSN